ncbi:MAG: TRM11 family SAM-dependent methyltransferase, partial [Candidatus Hodarchaeota archaeon]
LGGTVRIGEISFLIPANQHSVLKTQDWDFLFNDAFDKFKWGISFYSSSEQSDDFSKQVKNSISSFLKMKKIKANFKWSARRGSGSYYLDPTDISRHNMTSKGFECLIVKIKKNYYIGKTLAIFDAPFSQVRDLKRPQQLPSQAISLRLARMLINLSQVKPGDLLLDPFCGIGTLLQEGLYLGMRALGIELETSRVKMAQANLTWFQKNFLEDSEWNILQGDSRQLSQLFSGTVDGVATEPYLGPLLQGSLKITEARKRISELERFYMLLFRELEEKLKTGKKVAIILPVFPVHHSKPLNLDLSKILKGTKFHTWDILKGSNLHYLPYVYRKKESRLIREIYVLKKGK